ncbi:MAG: hypothetical protein KGY80_07640 [Candidatus Thorarchaeota archaeon]|nr:hypothetical protein [Candidatus Thorarchaeota archaeon]
MSENKKSDDVLSFDQIAAMSQDENLRIKVLVEKLPVVDLDWSLEIDGDCEEPEEMGAEQARWQLFVFRCMNAIRRVDENKDYAKLKWNEDLIGYPLLLVPITINEILGPIGLYPRFWGFFCKYDAEAEHVEAKKATISLPSAIFDTISTYGDLMIGQTVDPLNDPEVLMIPIVYHGLHEFKFDGENRQVHKFGSIDVLVGKRKAEC